MVAGDELTEVLKLAADRVRNLALANNMSPSDVLELLSEHLSDDGEHIAVAPWPDKAPKQRVYLSQAPADYDPSVGLVGAGSPAPEPGNEERERWVAMTTALLPLLGASSGYRSLMPVATPPESELRDAKQAVNARLAAALPQLEKLYRQLLPGWRETVLIWLHQHADRRVAVKYRNVAPAHSESLRDLQADIAQELGLPSPDPVPHPRWDTVMALPTLETSAELLEMLRRRAEGVPTWWGPGPLELRTRAGNPVLGDDVPDTLTAEMLAAAAELAGRKKMKGTREPETLIEALQDWAANPTTWRVLAMNPTAWREWAAKARS